MTNTQYNTLQLSALLRDIHRLAPEEKFAEICATISPGCMDLDGNLGERLISPERDDISNILQQVDEIVGLTAQPGIFQTPFASIFSRIKLEQNAPSPPLMTYHQTPWSQNDADIFPCEPFKAKIQGKTLLQEWRRRFLEFFKSARDFRALYAGTISLIDEYLWCIPIDAVQTDISLAEMARLKSAIAACLWKQQERMTDQPDNSRMLTLVVGDLSGIQKYVFEITEGGKGETGTAKRLRARSLFVQLLAEVGMQRTLAVYDLPPANILMASGGKFHILWPCFSDNQSKLHALQQEFDNWLLENLHGEIGLILAQTDVNFWEFRQGFGQVIDRAERALWEVKNRKFASILQAGNEWNEIAFTRPVRFLHGDCPSCKKFPSQSEQNEYCALCETDKNVGRQIAIGAKYLACYVERAFSEFTLSVLGRYVTVFTDQREIRGKPEFVLQLGGPFEPVANYPVFWRAAAPHVTKEPNSRTIMDFSAMAEAGAKTGKGRALLGYLKADADHLGKVFEWGFREISNGEITQDFDIPARFSMLSRQFDRFFGAWLSQYLKTTKEYQNIYTVFAGGDDVFLVGHWKTMVGLADVLRLKFQEFVGSHPEITLSAGIAMVKPREPSGIAAEQAETQVKKAKNTVSLERRTLPDETERKGRNQIALLGDTLTWETYQQMLQETRTLQRDNPRTAFLYHLLQYAAMWRQLIEDSDPSGYRLYPLLTYKFGEILTVADKPP